MSVAAPLPARAGSERPRLSIVVPAHNEEALIGRGLAALRVAIARCGCSAEVIVVVNRCTDRTEMLAAAAGAVVVVSEARSIAAVRNTGVSASSGEVIVTIDADTVIHPDALIEVDALITSGLFVGGGCRFVPERTSWGIAASVAVTRAVVRFARVGGVMLWCRREDFDAVGGFDESRPIAEDVDFARRLRRHGSRTGGGRFGTVTVPATICCRKFDRFGDWHMFAFARRAASIRRSMIGRDTRFVDEYFHDYNT